MMLSLETENEMFSKCAIRKDNNLVWFGYIDFIFKVKGELFLRYVLNQLMDFTLHETDIVRTSKICDYVL